MSKTKKKIICDFLRENQIVSLGFRTNIIIVVSGLDFMLHRSRNCPWENEGYVISHYSGECSWLPRLPLRRSGLETCHSHYHTLWVNHGEPEQYNRSRKGWTRTNHGEIMSHMPLLLPLWVIFKFINHYTVSQARGFEKDKVF